MTTSSARSGADFAGGWTSSVRWSHPCPGSCNRAFRRHEAARLVEWQRVLDGTVWADYGEGWTLAADPRLVSETGRRTGSPHWCSSCSQRILDDLARFPDLAAALWDAGHDPHDQDVVDEDGRPRLRVVTSREAVPGNRIAWVDDLACGHRVTYTWHPPLASPPGLRRCATCVLDRSSVDAGKIQTGTAGRTASGRRSGSPSGSPSWDAIDELITWTAAVETRVRRHFDLSLEVRNPHQGDAAARAHTLTRSVAFLLEHSEQMLALPEGVFVGRKTRALATRADRAAAADRVVTRMTDDCPTCQLRTLEREHGSEVVCCRRCGQRWTPGEYDALPRPLTEGRRA